MTALEAVEKKIERNIESIREDVILGNTYSTIAKKYRVRPDVLSSYIRNNHPSINAIRKQNTAYRRLTDNREEVIKLIVGNNSFGKMAKSLGTSPTTLSRFVSKDDELSELFSNHYGKEIVAQRSGKLEKFKHYLASHMTKGQISHITGYSKTAIDYYIMRHHDVLGDLYVESEKANNEKRNRTRFVRFDEKAEERARVVAANKAERAEKRLARVRRFLGESYSVNAIKMRVSVSEAKIREYASANGFFLCSTKKRTRDCNLLRAHKDDVLSGKLTEADALREYGIMPTNYQGFIANLRLIG